MGSMYWDYVGPYCEPAEEALRRAQVRFFQEAGYDIPSLLAERIDSMIEAVRLCEEDDKYNLLDFYSDALEQFRQMAAQELPEDPESQIEWLRRMEGITGDEVGNILDMEGISQEPEQWRVERLSPERLLEICGTTTPSLVEAREGVDAYDTMDRATALCIPVHEDGRPAAWFFAGCTAD